MDKGPSAVNQARAAVYHALAEALAEPCPGTQELLMEATTAGARLGGSAACREAALALADLPAYTSQKLASAYWRALNGSDGRPLALYESLHHQGRLAGRTTGEVERRYRILGLEPGEGELPDHASVELAFLGHLAAAGAVAQTRSFLRAHAATWLPELGSALAASAEPFYAIVGRLLRMFLYEELGAGRRHSQQTVHRPVLREPAACTLCGLCTGSCPTGALQVFENRVETALTLDSSRCVACRRCVNTCPEGVLVLSATTGRHSGAEERRPSTMRRSPRAACPVCGHPTVSRAELDAVFRRLEADASMETLLSLCVACKAVI